MKPLQLAGMRFGRLVVESQAGQDKRRHIMWNCICDCGNKAIVNGSKLRRNCTKSCGCLKKEIHKKNFSQTHELNQLKENGLAAMNDVYRYYKSNAKKKGIAFSLSLEIFKAISQGPCYYCGSVLTNEHKTKWNSLGAFQFNGVDRIDSDDGYYPENCVSCCSMCNIMKNIFSVKNFTNQINKIHKHMEQRNESN